SANLVGRTSSDRDGLTARQPDGGGQVAWFFSDGPKLAPFEIQDAHCVCPGVLCTLRSEQDTFSVWREAEISRTISRQVLCQLPGARFVVEGEDRMASWRGPVIQ